MRLRLNRDVSGIKAHTFTALAVLTNQKSYLTHDTCDCLNNITAHAASLPPRTHSLPAHTHGISNRIASPPPPSPPLSQSVALQSAHSALFSHPTFPLQHLPLLCSPRPCSLDLPPPRARCDGIRIWARWALRALGPVKRKRKGNCNSSPCN